MGIKENYEKIKKRTPKAVIVAVTKYVGCSEIIQAYEAGIKDFGENKIQDAEEKRQTLPEEIKKNTRWHFIGHLQTNKAIKAVGEFEYIHSVDSIKLATILSEYAKQKKIIQKVLVQINISEENTKYGIKSVEITEFFHKILGLESLKIEGLMTMAPFTPDKEQQRKVFKGLRKLRDQMENEYKINLPELSMGMSNDYETAYEEGATILRIGQAIFS
jgi:hypothetical protein